LYPEALHNVNHTISHLPYPTFAGRTIVALCALVDTSIGTQHHSIHYNIEHYTSPARQGGVGNMSVEKRWRTVLPDMPRENTSLFIIKRS